MTQELIRTVVEPAMEKIHYGPKRGTVQQRTSTCDGCGRKRKMFKRPFQALTPSEKWKYHSFCSECVALDIPALMAVRVKRQEEKRAQPRAVRFAYPCIGGPLDGQHATTADFDRDGMYAHLTGEYAHYNASGGGGPRKTGLPSMIIVHRSLLKPLINPKGR